MGEKGGRGRQGHHTKAVSRKGQTKNKGRWRKSGPNPHRPTTRRGQRRSRREPTEKKNSVCIRENKPAIPKEKKEPTNASIARESPPLDLLLESHRKKIDRDARSFASKGIWDWNIRINERRLKKRHGAERKGTSLLKGVRNAKGSVKKNK